MPDHPVDEEAELDAFVKGVTAPAVSDEEAELDEAVAARARAKELVDKQPTQMGGGVPLEQAPTERPWHENLLRDLGNSPMTRSVRSYWENVGNTALANTADEGSSALANLLPTEEEMPPELGGSSGTVPREHAAGSGFEDNRRTLAAEKQERDEQNPEAALAGNVTGAAAQTALLGSPAATGSLGARALANSGQSLGQLGAAVMGASEGDLGDRAQSALRFPVEHPIATTLAAAAPAAATGVSSGAKTISDWAHRRGTMMRPGAVMNSAQRAALMSNKGGPDAMHALGADIEARGVHLPNPGKPWYQNFWPASAEDSYKNASRIEDAAEAGFARNEPKLTAPGRNVNVDLRPVAQDLRGMAAEGRKSLDTKAGPNQASFAEDVANKIDLETTPADAAEATRLAGPDYPRQMVTQPRNADWQPEVTEEKFLPTGRMPLGRALKERRGFDNEINYDKRAGYENAGGNELVRRGAAAGMRKQTGEALDQLKVDDPSMAPVVDDWRQNNKDLSFAKTIKEPALLALQPEYGGGMSSGSFGAARIAKQVGLPSAAANLAASPGRVTNLLAGGMHRVGESAGGLSNLTAPEHARSLVAGLTPEQVEAPPVASPESKAKNTQMKETLRKALDGLWSKFVNSTTGM